MNTFFIAAQILLAFIAIFKSLPLIGFYNMKTCILVLILAVLSFSSLVTNLDFGNLALNLDFNGNLFISFGCLAVALTSSYGIRQPKFPYTLSK